MAVPCCGPKCSWCCTVFSFWGIIMLFWCGLFFWFGEVAMFDDLPILTDKSPENVAWINGNYNWTYAQHVYKMQAINCWIAMAMYGVTFSISVIMIYVNKLPKYSGSKKRMSSRHSSFN